MRVIVCGGRDYQNRKRVDEVLSAIHNQYSIFVVYHGGAKGADKFAAEWAESHGICHMRVAAHWETMGGSAGPVRNKWMLEFSDASMVIAFPGGAGTANMVKQAKEYIMPVLEIGDEGPFSTSPYVKAGPYYPEGKDTKTDPQSAPKSSTPETSQEQP